MVFGLVAVGGGVALGEYAKVKDRCTGARTELDGIWDDERRQEVSAAILSTERPYAPGTLERVERRLDDYARDWTDKHTQVCEATSVRMEQTEEAMELRMSCLRERRTALDAAVKVLARADDEVLKRAVMVVADLPELARCDDVERLRRRRQRVPPPEDPQVAAQVERLRGRIAELWAEQQAGKFTGLADRVDAAVEEAEALGYAPLLVEALHQRGILRDEHAEYADAARDMERVLELAIVHGLDRERARAAIRLTWTVGSGQARLDQGLVWGKVALALCRAPGLGPLDEASALGNIGYVLQTQGKLDEAFEPLRKSLVIKERVLGPTHPEVGSALNNLAMVLHGQDKLDEALDRYQRALAIKEDALGPTHPHVAYPINNIAAIVRDRGELDRALEHYRRALAILEGGLGASHSHVAGTLSNIAIVLKRQGKLDEALPIVRRALSIYEDTLGPDHPNLVQPLTTLGNVLHLQGRFEDALRHHRRGMAVTTAALGPAHPVVGTALSNIGISLKAQGKLDEALEHFRRGLVVTEEALGPTHPSVALVLDEIGGALREQGELDEAFDHYQRSLTIHEEARGPDHPEVAHVLVGLVEIALEREDYDAARAQAERALASCEASEVSAERLAEARFALARALWVTPAERPRARALAQRAKEGYVEHGRGREGERAEVERWLAERRVP